MINLQYIQTVTKEIILILLKPLRKVGNYFVVNLAIADLCITGFVNPFSIVGKFIILPLTTIVI